MTNNETSVSTFRISYSGLVFTVSADDGYDLIKSVHKALKKKRTHKELVKHSEGWVTLIVGPGIPIAFEHLTD